MSYILTFDQGTSSSRSILFDLSGKVVAVAQKEFRQFYPQDGWVEHDALEIWSSQLFTAQEVLRQAQVPIAEIVGIGITNQRETIVVWDRATGEPIYPAIVWQDRRTADFLEKEVRPTGAEEIIQSKAGLLIDPYFSASKIQWILREVPRAREQAERGELCAGTIDSWLIYQLTGKQRFVTDHTNASRTSLYNIHTLSWDADLLKLFDVPSVILPEVQASASVFGESTPDLFGRPLPILGVAGDQQSALFGQGCLAPGEGKNTYGTGCFMLMHTGEQAIRSQNKLLTTIACSEKDKPVSYALEGSVFIAGAIVSWLRDGLQIIQRSAEINELAQTVPDAGGVSFVPALVGMGAPYWNAQARGLLCGLQRSTQRGHIARAALEGIAWSVHDVIKAMEKDSGQSLCRLQVDGGAAASDLLMQLQSDYNQCEVWRPHSLEATALGAACVAGVTAGLWSAEDAPHAGKREGTIFSPRMKAVQYEREKLAWQKAVSRALHE